MLELARNTLASQQKAENRMTYVRTFTYVLHASTILKQLLPKTFSACPRVSVTTRSFLFAVIHKLCTALHGTCNLGVELMVRTVLCYCMCVPKSLLHIEAQGVYYLSKIFSWILLLHRAPTLLCGVRFSAYTSDIANL